MKESARRWWAMGAIAVAVLVVGLDLTVLSLALPTMAASLHATTGDLQWIADAYSLVLAALILPAGLLGDRYGRKKVLLIAEVIFVASSVWCAFSAGVGELITARAVLGVGAAALFPLSMSVIPVMFPEEERQKALTMLAAAMFIAYPIGPVLGGFLLDHFWWGSVFLINVPIGLLSLPLVAAWLPESRAQKRPGFDLPGIVTSSAALASVTYGFITAGQRGWTDGIALAAMCAGAVLLALFVAWERLVVRRGRGQPLVDLPLFGVAGFRWGTILMTCMSFALFGLMFTAPQYFQDVLGASPLGSGVRLLPMIGGMIAGMAAGTRGSSARKDPSGAPLPPLVSAKVLTAAGFAVLAGGLAAGAFTTLASGTGFAAAWVAVTGVGVGLAMPSAMTAALSPLTAERSGSGSALINATRQVGATIGVAILGTILSNGYASRLTGLAVLPPDAASAVRSSVAGGVAAARELGSPALLGMVRNAFIHGMNVMLWTTGGIAVTSALLALAFLPRHTGPAAGAGPAAGPAGSADAPAVTTAPGALVRMPGNPALRRMAGRRAARHNGEGDPRGPLAP